MSPLDTETVLDVLAEWLPGYTVPEEGPQSKIRLTFVDVDSITVEVETPANGGDTQEYTIRVQVEETV